MSDRRRPEVGNTGHPNVPLATVERIEASTDEGACWSATGNDLDVNLVAWLPRHGVGRHTNAAVDVLVVGIRGRGTLEVGSRSMALVPGGIHLIPQGAPRAIRATTRLLYLTCHRRRPRTFAPDELLRSPSRPSR